ncbi:2OG-Fe(II) oxygenase [Shewanella sp. NIFS-20-20]|uniref:2OG-Fe(II) oxygenase n=1 Tax=Shewanella sp. NIFS-20-20 TaxID=2853806 RepID=UPI001C478DFB|nr:2OG-Fe(II) oxygenase [Shewanella sp. NIFS-20-20]MBV7314641.1 2OG-Fe(II) oxygenase [Shewanella sp. NIFS-20-20]
MNFQFSETLLDELAEQLTVRGYHVFESEIPADICQALRAKAINHSDEFSKAAIGRGAEQQYLTSVRGDKILWLSPDNEVDKRYLDLMSQLRLAINRRLYLGLNEFESHYAIYHPGHHYQKHIDSLKGSQNRVLTSVLFLNPEWQTEHGGELLVYSEADTLLETVTPTMGKWVVFLSEVFPHEVVDTHVDRYSIAGWFRVSSSRHGY